jgi:hypothetical protein
VTTRDGEEVVVTEEVWSIDDEGKILASISQIPLRHAWAITVHKSQGMSLDEAVIDLSKAFTYGMGYVALSRVRSLDGLHLVGFTPESLQLDPRILAIDAQLQQRSDQAVLRLKTLSSDECSKKMNAFIRDTGGVVEPVDIEPETRKRGTFTGGQRTHEKSYELIESGKTLTEVAQERGLVVGTIIDHLHKSKEEGRDISFKHIKPSKEVYRLIKNAFHETMDKHTAYHEAKLTPVKRYLDKAGHDDIDFDTIKLVRLFLKD